MAKIHWLKPVNGAFQTTADWSNGVPGAADDAILDAAGTTNYTVTDQANTTVLSIQTASTATLSITAGVFTATKGTNGGVNAGTILGGDNTTFAIGGVFDNSGSIAVNSAGNTTKLLVNAAAVSLTGAGKVSLGDNSNNSIVGAAAADTLTNVSNTIEGSGNLGAASLTLINDAAGVIDATGTAAILFLDTGAQTVVNAGLIEATGAAGLRIVSTTVNDSSGGSIFAAAGSSVGLQSAGVIGGTLKTSGTGVIDAIDRGSLLDGTKFTVHSTGALDVLSNEYLTIQGTIANTGKISLQSLGNDTRLVIGAPGASLTGGGTISLDDNANNSINGAAASTTLTNVNDTIAGSGNLGLSQMTLVNAVGGVIDATGSAATLIVNMGAGSVVNAGLMEGSGSAGLVIQSTTVTNTGAVIEAAAGGNVQLRTADIVGGTLTTVSTGVIEAVDRGSLLDGKASALANAGVLDIINNAYLTISGTIADTATGSISLQSIGNDTRLLIAVGGATITGGKVTLSDDVNNSFSGSLSGAAGSQVVSTLTNRTTIAGAGFLGDGQMSLVNSGIIDATGASALVVDPGGGNAAGSNVVVNANLLEATNPGALTVTGGLTLRGLTVANGAAGVILANGAATHVDLQSATVIGGSLKAQNGGVIETAANDRGSVIDGSKSAVALTGPLDITNNAWLTIRGAIANGGSISLQSIGNDTRLVIGTGGATITGGQVLLTDNANNSFFGSLSGPAGSQVVSTLTNRSTITGAGSLGDSEMSLVNAGTIDATGVAALIIDTGGGNIAGSNVVANPDLLEATNPGALKATGGLTLVSVTVSNGTTGVIAASGAATHVDLQNATVTGGFLKALSGGVIETAANTRASVLDGSSVAVSLTGPFDITNNAWLTVLGTIANTAQINIQSSGNDTRLFVGAPGATLTGAGTVSLTDNANNTIQGVVGADTLTNFNNTIAGSGLLGNALLTLVNDVGGVIDATGSAASLILDTGSQTVVNLGLIEATGVAGLDIQNSTVENAGAIIRANAGSNIRLESADILSGKLAVAGSGFFETAANNRASVLDGRKSTVSLAGPLDITNNAWLTIQGGIANLVQISVQSSGNDTRLFIGAGGATLGGGGKLTLTDNANNTIQGAVSTDILTNVNNTISGAGLLGNADLTLVNEVAGVIDATGTAAALTLDTGSATVTNLGLIEASGAAGLTIFATTVNNVGGVILAATGSHVGLQSADILGGSLKVAGSGVFEAVDRGSIIDGSTSAVALSGPLDILNNEWLTIRGAVANTTTIAVQSGGNDTRLFIGAGGASLTGGGELTLTDNANNTIQGLVSIDTLTNVNNTIAGSGLLGNADLTLVNDAAGIIDATGTAAALILDSGGQTITNLGLIEATGAAGLTVLSTTVNGGASGQILAANGSHVGLQSADIVGGLLQTTGTGIFETIDRSSLIDGTKSTVRNAGTLDITNNEYLTVQGVIANTGAINLQSGGNDTRLFVGAAGATLTGAGKLTITDNANNTIQGVNGAATLTNSGNTISGAGQFGLADMTLVNLAAGVIDASGANALIINTGSNAISNAGLIEATGTGGATIQSAVVNTGVIEANGGAVTANGAVSGAGAALIVSGLIDFASSFSGNVAFNAVAGTLEMAQSQTYSGAISGFSTHGKAGSDVIDLLDIAFVGSGEAKFKGASTGGTLTVADGTHTAKIAFTGDYTLSTFVAASDGHGGTAITVNATIPVARPDSYSTQVSGSLTVTAATGVLANDVDPNGLALTATLVTGPAHGALKLSANGAFTYTAAKGFVGKDSFTYIAKDSLGQSAPSTVTVTVPAAGGPVANPDAYSDNAGQTLTRTAVAGVLANDTDGAGRPLTAALAPGGGPANGTLALKSDGSFVYTPNAGFAGKDTFSYIASDGVASSPPTTVTITVAARAPLTAADAYSDNAGQGLTETAAAGVLANDKDLNGLALSAAVATGGGPAHGTVSLNADGSFTYTPNTGFAGTDSFTYVASDSLSSSAATKVTVTVRARAPTTKADSYTTQASGSLTVTAATGVLANDTDLNGLALTASLASGGGPSHGTLTLNADGSFSYAANKGFTGTDSFTYLAKDSLSSSGPTKVTISVPGGSGGPVTTPDSYIDNAGQTLTETAALGVLANDTDGAGRPLTAALATGGGPANGTLTLHADGSFTYTPNKGFAGQDTFSYIASDGVASSAPTTVTITVSARTPIANPDSYTTSKAGSLTVTAATGVLANDTDLNGIALTASLYIGPSHGSLTLNADGSFSYTANKGFSGTDSFDYVAFDSLSGSTPTKVTITVPSSSGGPVTTLDSYGDSPGQTLTETAATGVLANDTDTGGRPLTATLASGGGPAHGSLTLKSDGSFAYTPTKEFTGTDSFFYVASDGLASSPPTKVTITVASRAPIARPDSYNAIVNQTLTVGAALGVLANDTDPNGLKLTAALAPGGGPQFGDLTLNADGSFTYLLSAGFGGFQGTDTFSYIASDGLASSGPTEVTINISNGSAQLAAITAAHAGAAHFVGAMAAMGVASPGYLTPANGPERLAQPHVAAPNSRVALS